MLNRVVLVGRLTRDPDLRYTPQGTPVVTFTLAVNRTFTNQSGQREADFINCVAWRRTAENVANFLNKGSMAGVDGRLQTRTYDSKEGQRVWVTEVLAESVQFLESKSKSQNEANPGYDQSFKGQRNNREDFGDVGAGRDPFTGGKHIDVSDDDLPF
ncbi:MULTISPECIES: single-stranded DNA-binding protein [Bacillus]|uniref:single-stranded DNA-binding protein n=1 Tax=Bacillus TaxID=1386 RepID=UPI001ABE2F62|nr:MULTISPECIES: single-stranded DNA-binding protein [Bacillus]MBR7817990.1 single-stranded DNA-binding protein [Bacillus sp. CCNWLCWHY013]MDJ0479950.1 single-stranded DNA-binding protein [Bacillus amyloliquefaciens]QTG87466.1 single-stranded DNA-binding protein [Bacillus amyloliquefaciens]